MEHVIPAVSVQTKEALQVEIVQQGSHKLQLKSFSVPIVSVIKKMKCSKNIYKVFNFERLAKSIMADALNPGCESFFCKFCDNRRSKVAGCAGVRALTLKSSARCHGGPF